MWQRIENSGGNSYHVRPQEWETGDVKWRWYDGDDDDDDDDYNDDDDDINGQPRIPLKAYLYS